MPRQRRRGQDSSLPPPAIIFSIFVAGTATAVAVGCLLLWQARGRTSWLGWMSLFAGNHALLALGQLLRNTSSDVATGDVAMRVVSSTSCLAALFWLMLYHAFCGTATTWADWALSGLLMAGIAYALASPGGAALAEVNAISTYPAGWWGPISVVQGPLDPLAVAFHALYLLVVVRLTVLVLGQRRRLGGVSCTLMLLSTTAVLVPIVHGLGLNAGWWRGVPLAEYALSTVFLLLCVETFRRERSHDRHARDRQARLEAILEHGLGFAGLLDPSGRLVLANRVALRAIKVTADSVVGRHFADTPWWTHSAEAQERLRAAIAKAACGAPDRFVTTHRLPDGNELEIDFSLTPFLANDGSVLYLIAEGRDISELRRFERLMRDGSRLEAIGQLAGGIAHDFNNVLSGIMGAAELALLRASDPEVKRRLETILSATGKAGDLTKRLLAYARKAKTANVEVRVNTLVGETLELFRRGAGPDIRVERILEAAPDCTTGDPAELQSALLNLCVNARDAMPGGGVLRLATSRLELPAGSLDCMGLPIAPGTYLRIDVGDTGTGIPDSVRPRIFEPFFTTKPEGQGTGLGLPAVLGTARVHHGTLLLETAAGRGTTISLLLPATVPTTPSGFATAVAKGADGGLVVLVDDETSVRETAADLLRSLGFRVESFGEPRIARERLRILTGVRCVILDLAMPGVNGRDLYQQIRAAAPDMPVVICSGYAGGGQILGGDDDPRLAFLPKPWRLGQLRATLLRLGVLTAA